jgi:nucleotide-binding universal stress UspA family protein
MFKKILFPTDFSENSRKAIAFVLDTVRKYGAEVVLLHVYDFPVRYAYEGAYTYAHVDMSQIEDQLKESATKQLHEFKLQLEQEGVPVKTVLRRGVATREIIEVSQEEQCELIIIGSRGFGPVKSFLLGSVSNYVVHHSHMPVLVIPPHED